MAFDNGLLEILQGQLLWRSAINANFEDLDEVRILQGTFVARPSAANAGRYYYATDVKVLFRDDGSNWQVIGRPALNSNVTNVGNNTIGETDLMTYTLPANLLGRNAEAIYVSALFAFAANANNKTVKMYLGATQLFTTGAIAANGDFGRVDAVIFRTGSSAQRYAVNYLHSDAALVPAFMSGGTGAIDLTASVVIKFTGESGILALDDVVQNFMKVELTGV